MNRGHASLYFLYLSSIVIPAQTGMTMLEICA
jgi:hypothetical protein